MVSQVKRLCGALCSGKKSAYLAIFIMFVGPLLRLLDHVVYKLYSQTFEKKAEGIPDCYFMVSTPRSGSTVIYQALVRSTNCKYITNLHILFPNHASYIIKFLPRKSLKLTRSYYSYTESIFDVNEGNLLVDELFRGSVEEIRARFLKLLRKIDHTGNNPIIIKNVRNYDRIEILHQAVPELKFVRIKREPVQIIQSVLRAYHELGTFHPVTPLMKVVDDPILKAIRQYDEMNKTLELQCNRIQRSLYCEIKYESFCRDPGHSLKGDFWEYMSLDETFLPKLRISNKQKVNDFELTKILENYNEKKS